MAKKKPTGKKASDIRAYEGAFKARKRSDLRPYKSNSRLLHALEMRFGISDIHSVASDALTDGGGDKKCDLVYIDPDTQVAVIAQGYESTKVRKEASSNKAAT